MNSTRAAKEEGAPGCTLLVFFSFVCPALLALLYFNGRGFAGLPDTGQLLGCMSVLLLLSAAYTGSFYGSLCLPLTTALFGFVSAAAVCAGACGLREREAESLQLLLVLAAAVPLQFAISASGMRMAALLRRAVNDMAGLERERLRPQNIMMFVSWAALACLVAYIFFR